MGLAPSSKPRMYVGNVPQMGFLGPYTFDLLDYIYHAKAYLRFLAETLFFPLDICVLLSVQT